MIDAIRRSEGFVPSLSLVAEDEGEIVGQALFSYVALASSSRRLLELGPISVRPDRQREGIGGLLIREGIARAEELEEPVVLVLGHPDYYPRFGFEPASRFGLFPSDPNIPDEAFMAMPLKRYDPEIGGRVIFPAAYFID